LTYILLEENISLNYLVAIHINLKDKLQVETVLSTEPHQDLTFINYFCGQSNVTNNIFWNYIIWCRM